MKFLFEYGEKVDGYNVRVVNEREARAAAGILFAFGIMALFNSIALGHLMFTKYFLTFFTVDFFIRIINPNYSPSLLMGRFFVQNQTPEYVGAIQKRFAWGIGFLLAFPMFYTVVVDFTPNPLKVLLCMLCLVLLISESAFSICVGCKIYNLFYKEKATHCPGDVCEIKRKEKIQTFNIAQKIIAITSFVLISYGVYAYLTKVESKTFFAKKVSQMFMTEAQLQAIEDEEYKKEAEAFDNDDDF